MVSSLGLGIFEEEKTIIQAKVKILINLPWTPSIPEVGSLKGGLLSLGPAETSKVIVLGLCPGEPAA